MWFHSAHVLSKGTGFGGDHDSLYGRIYTELVEQIDAAMEKGVGLTNEEEIVCTHSLTTLLQGAAKLYDSPVNKPGIEIARIGLNIVQDFLKVLEASYKVAKSQDLMTLGLEDFIADLANTHEGYVYLLQQRTKNND